MSGIAVGHIVTFDSIGNAVGLTLISISKSVNTGANTFTIVNSDATGTAISTMTSYPLVVQLLDNKHLVL